jgi:DNA-binding NtrC family response regulator
VAADYDGRGQSRNQLMTDKAHILVVEDDTLVSEVIAAALDDTYCTTLVGTAGEALALLRNGGIKLILLDCTLPGGLDANLIPEADRLGTPIILMSGDRSRIDALVDGPRPFVLKPFTLVSLIETVDRVLALNTIQCNQTSN